MWNIIWYATWRLLTRINQNLSTPQLALAGSGTAVANHGEECLDILASSPNEEDDIDNILVDLEAPFLDGSQRPRKYEEGKLPAKFTAPFPLSQSEGTPAAENTSIEIWFKKTTLMIASSIGIYSCIVKSHEKQSLLSKISMLTGVGRMDCVGYIFTLHTHTRIEIYSR